MLISEFAQITGLSRDTVRFYMRLGLLRPTTTTKGGRNPYHFFSDEDVQTAEIIRSSQSLGMSLKEIAAISAERREGRITRERTIEILNWQLAELAAKAAELASMRRFLRDKIDWVAGDQQGQRPDLRTYIKDGGRGTAKNQVSGGGKLLAASIVKIS